MPALIATCAWVITLTILLTLWINDNHIRYYPTNPNIVYISNVGARYQTSFIVGSSITAFFFALTMLMYIFAHRKSYKFHRANRTAVETPAEHKRFVLFDVLSFLFACISAGALIGLSVYNSVDYSTVHWTLTLIFIVTLAISAIFNASGVRWLHRRGMNRLFVSKIIKIVVVTIAVLLAIVMIILMSTCSGDKSTQPSCMTRRSVAAVMEWIIAGLFAVFLATCIGEATGRRNV